MGTRSTLASLQARDDNLPYPSSHRQGPIMSDTPVKPKNPDLTRTLHTREDSAEPTKGPANPPKASKPLPEKIGDYRIIAKLGEGGMGAVYRAEDTKLEREVALKVMRPEIAAHPASKERFLREAKAVAALKHDRYCPPR
jgi:hypothetical protein